MYPVPGNFHNCHDSFKPDPIKFSIVTLNKELPLLLAKAGDTFINVCMYGKKIFLLTYREIHFNQKIYISKQHWLSELME